MLVSLLTHHYIDVIMTTITSQITRLAIVYSIVSDADQRKHESSASLAFVRGIHRGPVNSPHKWPVTRIMFPFDDVIMIIPTNHTHAQKVWWNYFKRQTSTSACTVEGWEWISSSHTLQWMQLLIHARIQVNLFLSCRRWLLPTSIRLLGRQRKRNSESSTARMW